MADGDQVGPDVEQLGDRVDGIMNDAAATLFGERMISDARETAQAIACFWIELDEQQGIPHALVDDLAREYGFQLIRSRLGDGDGASDDVDDD